MNRRDRGYTFSSPRRNVFRVDPQDRDAPYVLLKDVQQHTRLWCAEVG